MSKKKIAFYMHTGADNRGCEAIVRSTSKIFKDADITVYSSDVEADKKVGLDAICKIESIGKKFVPHSFNHICLKIKSILTRDYYTIIKYRYKNLLKNVDKYDYFFSIGGDNYCGYGLETEMHFLNHYIRGKGVKTVLWGCSIEPDMLTDKAMINDLNDYSMIVARETLTYEALKQHGVTTKILLVPDPAFVLDTQKTELPDNFIVGDTIGINISPLIQNRENGAGAAYNNYRDVIKYIIDNTSSNIALIPHVIKSNSDDRIPLKQLHEEFKATGRVVMFNEKAQLNCMQLKYIISKCKMIITARTHASIAAYSTAIPTFVVGYSVKSKGIAKDIFGSYDNYVVPVSELTELNELTTAFKWMLENESKIKEHLKEKMPSFEANINNNEGLKSLL